MSRKLYKMIVLVLLLSLLLPYSVAAKADAKPLAAEGDVVVTILHTNDFHGNLEASATGTTPPGAARLAQKIKDVRALSPNTLLVDAGDELQGTLLSNLNHGKPVVDYYKYIGYDAATFGNHEFDWGQAVLQERVDQAADTTGTYPEDYPYLSANIVKQDTLGGCTGWDKPDFVTAPYTVITSGGVKFAFIGVTTQEVPNITVATATAGLCFLDPEAAIEHYYDAMKAEADVIVVLSHLGFVDGGYGYGTPVYGDQTLATRLNTALKPVDLIIGGHSHTDRSATTAGALKIGNTYITQAANNGLQLGQFTVTYNTISHTMVSVAWTTTKLTTANAADPGAQAVVDAAVNDPAYQTLITTPIGYTKVNLDRNKSCTASSCLYSDNMMASFINDAALGALNEDAVPENDADLLFNNSGGIRADLCAGGGGSPAAPCSTAVLDPAMQLTYGMMFSVLPFGNQLIVGDMTGAQIMDVLNQSGTLAKGAIQVAGIKYSYYHYEDANPGPQPWAWGAYDVVVWDKASSSYLPLEMNKTYRVATNEFLAPAGGDSYSAFKYMKNITYWGDMLNMVDANIMAHHSTPETAYMGPKGDGTLDGRIIRDGSNAGGTIIPLTVLHHNDSHGRVVAYEKLATIIKQERVHNPTRTLLLSSGDNIQGDSFSYFYKSAGLGYSADGATLPDALKMQPLIKAFNSMGYDAMTLGNHEFNFGPAVFSTLADATFPILQANIADTGEYGIGKIPVLPYTAKTVGAEGIKVSILGIGNHRIPNYELPSNIPGLSFSNPLDTAESYAPWLKSRSDVLIALTHIGFAEDAKSVEVDKNVDVELAKATHGVDVVVGGHSHSDPTNPAFLPAPYQYLPTTIGGPDNTPVLIGQANRYNTQLGEMSIGLRAKVGGGYEVVSRAGRSIVVASSTTPDPTVTALLQPYIDNEAIYRTTVIGSTITPLETNASRTVPAGTTSSGYIEETNGANLQADAAVWKLRKEVPVDFHLSGAMTNGTAAAAATPSTPVTLTIADMFNIMPYENSLLVMSLNGPQLKAILERAYRNYYYYKYVPGFGGYSHYTTCMLDTDKGSQITYADTYPTLPSGNNVVSLTFNNGANVVDFTDASTYYNVSTVNYLAAGSCNFNDGGVSLWPLDQIVHDTQYYVRDSVVEYVQGQTGAINPGIEGRLQFTSTTFDLTVNIAGSGAGTVAKDPDFTTFGEGAKVTLTANPEPGSVFTGWTGDVTSMENPLVVTMDAAKSITANFALAYDGMDTATQISLPGGRISRLFYQDVSGATIAPEDPTYIIAKKPTQGFHSVWFTFTPFVDGRVSITTAGSDYDTIAGLYTSTAAGANPSQPSLTRVAWADNGAKPASFSAKVKAGMLYYVEVVAKTDVTTANLQFRITYTPTFLKNDRIGAAIKITPTAALAGFVKPQDVSKMTTDPKDPKFPGMTPLFRTNWYRFTPTASGTLHIDTAGSNFETMVGVWTGKTSALVNAAYGNGTASLEVTAGTVYYIEIASLDEMPYPGTQSFLGNKVLPGYGANQALLVNFTPAP